MLSAARENEEDKRKKHEVFAEKCVGGVPPQGPGSIL
jgi:hypothetical protein